MLERLMVHATDIAATQAFYATALGGLGTSCPELRLAPASLERPVTHGLHIGVAAPSRAAVDAFWAAGVAAGHPSDGEPGPRPRYRDDYYGGFLLDPDGNSVEAVHHADVHDAGRIDHLWIRVVDLDATRAWWAVVGERAGLRPRVDTHELIRWAGPGKGSITFVRGVPVTEHAHLVFAVTELELDEMALDLDGNRVELVRP